MDTFTAKDLLKELRLVDGLCDPWGSCLSLHFEVCDHLEYRGAFIPDEWEYSPGMCSGLEDDSYFFSMLQQTPDDELIKLGNILHRYESALQKQGRNY